MFKAHAFNRSLLITLLIVIVGLLQFTPIHAQDDEANNCTPSQPNTWIVYTAQGGETLNGIALRLGIEVQSLIRANCIRPNIELETGDEIFMPDPELLASDNLIERCRNAGISAERCRWLIFGDNQNDEVRPIVRRCRLAGLTIEECREIIGNQNDLDAMFQRCVNAGISETRCRWLIYGDDDNTTDNPLLRRCELAGLTTEECREIIGDQNDLDAMFRRCINAGISETRCRWIVYGDNEDDINGEDDDISNELRRCLNAGFTPEECRRILNDDNDTPRSDDNIGNNDNNNGNTNGDDANNNANDDDNTNNDISDELRRCLDSGLTREECRRALNDNTPPANNNNQPDDDNGEPPADRPEDTRPENNNG